MLWREFALSMREVFTGGLNNLITPEKYRGRGLAAKVLERVDELIFKELHCDAGLLLCADSLVLFIRNTTGIPFLPGCYLISPAAKRNGRRT